MLNRRISQLLRNHVLHLWRVKFQMKASKSNSTQILNSSQQMIGWRKLRSRKPYTGIVSNTLLRKYYPDGRKVSLLLGPNELRQETLPRRLLYDNSSYFKAIYDQQERDEELDETIKLPDVDPDVFGLAI